MLTYNQKEKWIWVFKSVKNYYQSLKKQKINKVIKLEIIIN